MRDKTGKNLSTTEILKKLINRLDTIWQEIIVYKLHLVGCVPFHRIRRSVYRLFGMKMGRGSAIHMHARFYNPSNIFIGEDTIIGEFSVLDGRDKLIIGNHVDIASNVMIYNSEHNVHTTHFAAVESVVKAPVVIEDYVFVGPGVIILPGVTLGKGCVVGAGAVVTKSVGEFEIVGGVPAKVIGERKNKDPHYTLGRAAWFR